jgi:hypothetical protein
MLRLRAGVTMSNESSPKKTPVQLIQQRIDHHQAEAVRIDEMFEQFRERLGTEIKGGNSTGADRIQTFVKELSKIETLRAANRAVLSELEVLRIVLEG